MAPEQLCSSAIGHIATGQAGHATPDWPGPSQQFQPLLAGLSPSHGASQHKGDPRPRSSSLLASHRPSDVTAAHSVSARLCMSPRTPLSPVPAQSWCLGWPSSEKRLQLLPLPCFALGREAQHQGTCCHTGRDQHPGLRTGFTDTGALPGLTKCYSNFVQIVGAALEPLGSFEHILC